jgi:hypothetical protein
MLSRRDGHARQSARQLHERPVTAAACPTAIVDLNSRDAGGV